MITIITANGATRIFKEVNNTYKTTSYLLPVNFWEKIRDILK